MGKQKYMLKKVRLPIAICLQAWKGKDLVLIIKKNCAARRIKDRGATFN